MAALREITLPMAHGMELQLLLGTVLCAYVRPAGTHRIAAPLVSLGGHDTRVRRPFDDSIVIGTASITLLATHADDACRWLAAHGAQVEDDRDDVAEAVH
ncbi:hypothetical protein CSC62_07435 [Pseudoxanthomonas jiangsuensis]|uniref:hypothetical protein n=1 Tax=Pseudoxanthomonas jiangsuensis TaxID=619688 RepID=UPI0013917CBC|nr:hypothetical protein [Pseudoxanthomonas jiangsuensis]KAF1697971.1 hypothetical protein CSC62_07435 [Pseudoxanthomonas jiangsuensis]